ncbi:hypothetical protein IBX65_06605 [Candidatus Aerophobetes bacterium]|nr:hypothetical protein [Candidatus Aerophobetes bacterium]
MNNLVILIVIIPLIASFFCLIDKYIPHLQLAQIVSIGATLICMALLAVLFPPIFRGDVVSYSVGGWKEPLGISLHMDGFAWISSCMSMVVALFALIFAWAEKEHGNLFYFVFLIFIAGMQGVTLTGDIFNMFVFFEIFSIASYILIAYEGKTKSILASFNYLLISSLGMGFFLLGIVILYQHTGVLSLNDIANLMSKAGNSDFTLNLALICFVVGIGIKAAFIPLHIWLPDAHAFAPHPVSAILSGIAIKVSFLAIWRIILLFQAFDIEHIFLWVGAFTAFLGVIWAVAQVDSKKLLAYHSISQIGFIVVSFGVGRPLALDASYYHLLNHAFFKSLLFLCIGSVIYATGQRHIHKLGALRKKMPTVFFSFLVGMLAICGIPPFDGYASKALISISLNKHPVVYFFIFLSSIITVTSFLKLSGIFTGKPNKEKTSFISYKIPAKMRLSLVALSIICLATGIAPHFWIRTLDTFVTGRKLDIIPTVYSLHQLVATLLMVGLGFALYLFIRSSPGKKTLRFIRGFRLGLNNSILLVVVTFLIFILLSWIVAKGFVQF